jgi:hypothetical protein
MPVSGKPYHPVEIASFLHAETVAETAGTQRYTHLNLIEMRSGAILDREVGYV